MPVVSADPGTPLGINQRTEGTLLKKARYRKKRDLAVGDGGGKAYVCDIVDDITGLRAKECTQKP